MPTTERNDAALCPQDLLFAAPEELRELAARYATPFYLFDEGTMRKSIAVLRDAFPSDAEYYVPAACCGRRGLLRLLRELGLGVSCNSEAELQIAVECGFTGQALRYAAVTLEENTARRLRNLDATLTLLSPLAIPTCLPRQVMLRCYLPGFCKPRLSAANVRHDPFGLTPEEIAVSLESLHHAGGETFGLSMPQGRNVLNEGFYAEKLEALGEIREEILAIAPRGITAMDLGNGLGVEYRRLHPQPDVRKAGTLLRQKAAQLQDLRRLSLSPWQSFLEPSAILVGRVQGILHRQEDMLITDISSACTRIAYPARSRFVSLSGKAEIENRVYCSILGTRGSICEWLGKKQILPPAEIGDLLVFHDAGCSMTDSRTLCLLREVNGRITVL